MKYIYGSKNYISILKCKFFFLVETGMVSQSKGLSNYVCYIKSSPWTNFNNSVFNWYGTANLKKH